MISRTWLAACESAASMLFIERQVPRLLRLITVEES